MASEISRPPGEIPEGITFGDKVVVLPYMSTVFDRAFRRPPVYFSNPPSTLYPPLAWVNRGEYLIAFTIFTPKTGIPFIDFFVGMNVDQICIRSPVSGLLIHCQMGYSDEESVFNTALLIPDDEPPTEDGAYMFSRLCGFCFEHREHMFYRRSEFTGIFNDQLLSEASDEQMSRTCKYIDAMPMFEGYFREARTRHSKLRPLLKHLL